MRPTTGSLLGAFRVERRLAIGGMAEIFLAHSLDHSAPVVLKLLLPQLCRDAELTQMLADEAALTAHLDHPNLVKTLAYEDGQHPYLVLEYVEGCTLAQLLRSHAPLAPAFAFAVAHQLLAALRYIHAYRDRDGTPLEIVHRDVTPGNVLLALDGSVKLGDFGIARSDLRTARTRTGVIKGTVQYMSPEQVCGDPLDQRADLYGVGLLLFEMLCGRPYIDAKREVDLLRCAESPRWRPPSSVRPGLDLAIDRLLEPALRPFPEQRYPSAEAMSAALERCAAELSISIERSAALCSLIESAAAAHAAVMATRPEPTPLVDESDKGAVEHAIALKTTALQRRGDRFDADKAQALTGISSGLIEAKQLSETRLPETPQDATRSSKSWGQRIGTLLLLLVFAVFVGLGVVLWPTSNDRAAPAQAVPSATGPQRHAQRPASAAAAPDATSPLGHDSAPDIRHSHPLVTPSPPKPHANRAVATRTRPRVIAARHAVPPVAGTTASPRRAPRASAARPQAAPVLKGTLPTPRATANAPATDKPAASKPTSGKPVWPKELGDTIAHLARQGIALADLPPGLRQEVQKLRLGTQDPAAVADADARWKALRGTLSKLRVDRSFVENKLVRIDRSLRALPANRSDLPSLRKQAARALSAFIDGQYALANRLLNGIVAALSR